MIRKVVFLCALVPMLLAGATSFAIAAPNVSHVGNARVQIVVSPDPPVAGTNAVTVQIYGASPSALNSTNVRYRTLMPSMNNMSGPSGVASRVAGRAEWRFNVMFGMAAPWTLRVQLSGGINGTLNETLVVGEKSTSAQAAPKMAAPPANAHTMNSMPGMAMSSSSGSMSGMNMSGDTAAPWRNATFALAAVIIIAALVLWKNRKPVTIAIVILAGLTVVGIAYAQSRNGSPAMDMASMQSASGSAPVPVTLARVGGDPDSATIQAPANVQPYLTQDIVARAPGVLTDFNSYTGDRLKAGQVVAHLEEPELQSNAQAARAAAQAAQSQQVSAQENTASMRADVTAAAQNLRYWNAEIARERELLAQGAVSQQEYQNELAQAASARSAYDSARAKVASASAAAQAAQAQVSQSTANAQSQAVLAGYTNVVAPSDSVVMKRLVDPGVYVQPGTPILQVAVVDRLRVQAQVAQQDLPSIDVGTPVDVTFGNGKVVHGQLSSISPVVDPNTHTAIAEAIVPNDGGTLQPGGFVHVLLRGRTHAAGRTFAVPSGAVVGGADTAVWADVSGRAHRVPVTVVSDDGTTAQVSGDIHSGMQIVVTGAADLEEGQPITEAHS